MEIGNDKYQGYFKEIRIYSDIDGDFNFQAHRQMMHKNSKALLSSPYNYPYLVEYYRFTTINNKNSHIFRNLAIKD